MIFSVIYLEGEYVELLTSAASNNQSSVPKHFAMKVRTYTLSITKIQHKASIIDMRTFPSTVRDRNILANPLEIIEIKVK